MPFYYAGALRGEYSVLIVPTSKISEAIKFGQVAGTAPPPGVAGALRVPSLESSIRGFEFGVFGFQASGFGRRA